MNIKTIKTIKTIFDLFNLYHIMLFFIMFGCNLTTVSFKDNKYSNINKKFEYKILFELFEYSLGFHINQNIIYKKNLESFFLYPLYSTLIFFFNDYEIIKNICFNLMKHSFIETRIQNYIIILVNEILNNMANISNYLNEKNTNIYISNLIESEILNYITAKSFYIQNNYKKFILQILIKDNNFLDYFKLNKITIVIIKKIQLLVIKNIIKFFMFFKKKINSTVLLNKFFFKNISLSEKSNKIFFFKGIILKKNSTTNKFRKFKYLNVKLLLIDFESILCTSNFLQHYKNKINYTATVEKTLSQFFYKIKKTPPIIILTHSKRDIFIDYISKKLNILIETNFNPNTLNFLQTYLKLPVFNFFYTFNIVKSTKSITQLDIINEKYKKWIFLTNDGKKLFATIIGSFKKYFLFDYFILLLKSLIMKIYNLLVDSRLCLNNGVLEYDMLNYISKIYLNNKSHIYFFPLVSIIKKYFKNKKTIFHKFFKNFKKNTQFKNYLPNPIYNKFNCDNYNWASINEKVAY